MITFVDEGVLADGIEGGFSLGFDVLLVDWIAPNNKYPVTWVYKPATGGAPLDNSPPTPTSPPPPLLLSFLTGLLFMDFSVDLGMAAAIHNEDNEPIATVNGGNVPSGVLGRRDGGSVITHCWVYAGDKLFKALWRS